MIPTLDQKSFLEQQGFTCKNIQEISLKDVGSRKKIECLVAQHNNNLSIFFISVGKSRVLKNEFDKLETLKDAVEKYKDIMVQEKVYFYAAPMCSKAFKYGEALGWSSVNVSL